MSITKDSKTKVIQDYQQTEKDTGSPEVQVAILTTRINNLASHFERIRRITIPAAACSR